MTQAFCERNRRTTVEAIGKALDGEPLTDQETNRLVVCGACPRTGLRPESSRAFRSLVSDLLEKLERFDEWGFDPELAARRRSDRRKRYREKHQEAITKRRREYSLEKRIQILKRRIGDESYD